MAGGQSAAIAAAEELSKMNMAEITEEKAEALKGRFIELGAKIGKESGSKAGEAAGNDADLSLAIKEAQEAARQAPPRSEADCRSSGRGRPGQNARQHLQHR